MLEEFSKVNFLSGESKRKGSRIRDSHSLIFFLNVSKLSELFSRLESFRRASIAASFSDQKRSVKEIQISSNMPLRVIVSCVYFFLVVLREQKCFKNGEFI